MRLSNALKQRFSYLVCVFLFLAFSSSPIYGQQPVEKSLEGFDKFVEEEMNNWKVPGLAVAVVKNGETVYVKGYGFRDVKNGLKVTPDTLFAIGSCTKAFTASALGILVDEGKVEWDKPVKNYLPSFKLNDEYATAHMTPRDLVTHQSGLPRHDGVWYGSPLTRKELFDRLQYLEPSKPLRSTYQYNNLMFMTAGVLVGQISNLSWEEFIKKRILDPLEMKSANFSVSASQKSSDFALPYEKDKDQVKEIPFRSIDSMGPAGSINSNVAEMANWAILNLNKGKFKDKQIISEASLSRIHSPQIVIPGELKYDEVFYSSYAMGWIVTSYRGHLRVNHGGNIDGFSALVSLLPRDKVGVVVLVNKSSSPLTAIVAANVLDRLLGMSEIPWSRRIKEEQDKAEEAAAKAKAAGEALRKTGTQASHAMKDFAGRYEHPAYGTLTIALDGDKMKGDIHGIPFTLKHFHYDVFEIDGEPGPLSGQKIAFTTGKDGEISQVAVPLEPNVKDIAFSKAPELATIDRSALEKFVGEYELANTIVAISLRADDMLTATVPGQPTYELIPNKDRLFFLKNMEGYKVEFKQDASGKVDGAVFHQPNGSFSMKRK